MEPPFIFEGRPLKNMGDCLSVIVQIANAQDKARAARFVEAYEKITTPKIVRENIGYGAGYYDSDTATRIFETFDVRHPYFGRTSPHMEWALELGERKARGGARPEKVG